MSERVSTYTVVGSDQCREDAIEVQCYDELDYCVDFALEKWLGDDGQLSYSVCAEGEVVVAFRVTDHVPAKQY